MKLHELKPTEGSKRNKRRVGRGNGSGMGNYATRGMKGQKSRSGGSIRRGFAGGQLSMIKALPMLRGFTNKFRTEYIPINIASLNSFESGSTVGLEELCSKGLVKNKNKSFSKRYNRYCFNSESTQIFRTGKKCY